MNPELTVEPASSEKQIFCTDLQCEVIKILGVGMDPMLRPVFSALLIELTEGSDRITVGEIPVPARTLIAGDEESAKRIVELEKQLAAAVKSWEDLDSTWKREVAAYKKQFNEYITEIEALSEKIGDVEFERDEGEKVIVNLREKLERYSDATADSPVFEELKTRLRDAESDRDKWRALYNEVLQPREKLDTAPVATEKKPYVMTPARIAHIERMRAVGAEKIAKEKAERERLQHEAADKLNDELTKTAAIKERSNSSVIDPRKVGFGSPWAWSFNPDDAKTFIFMALKPTEFEGVARYYSTTPGVLDFLEVHRDLIGNWFSLGPDGQAVEVIKFYHQCIQEFGETNDRVVNPV